MSRIYEAAKYFDLQLNASESELSVSFSHGAAGSGAAAQNVRTAFKSVFPRSISSEKARGSVAMALEVHSLCADLFFLLAGICKLQPDFLVHALEDDLTFSTLYHTLSVTFLPGVLHFDELSSLINLSVPYVILPPYFRGSQRQGYIYRTRDNLLISSLTGVSSRADTSLNVEVYPLGCSVRYYKRLPNITPGLIGALAFVRSGFPNLVQALAYGSEPVPLKALSISLPIEVFLDPGLRDRYARGIFEQARSRGLGFVFAQDVPEYEPWGPLDEAEAANDNSTGEGMKADPWLFTREISCSPLIRDLL